MFDLWRLLIQFVFRVTWGLALSMGVTSHRQVTSGYFQKHLWVLMGLNTLASLAIYSQRSRLAASELPGSTLLTIGIGLTVTSYLGSICWLAERPRAGRGALVIIATLALLGSMAVVPWSALRVQSATDGASTFLVRCLPVMDLVTSGLLLGVILAAMFLGHWYLNTPTMQLAPLRRLIALLAIAVEGERRVRGEGQR